jgi:hypothetical protein
MCWDPCWEEGVTSLLPLRCCGIEGGQHKPKASAYVASAAVQCLRSCLPACLLLCHPTPLQGWTAAKIEQLMEQLSQYGKGKAPFDLAVSAGGVGASFSSRAWWESVCSSPSTRSSASVVAELAIMLNDVVPHAAEPERVFSKLGWYQSGKSARLSSAVATQKATIKMHYDGVKLVEVEGQEVEVPDIIDLSVPVYIAAAAGAAPAVAAAAAEAAASQRSSSSQQAPAAEEGEEGEDVTAEQLQAALQQQYEDDKGQQAEDPVPAECRQSWRAAMLWSMGVTEVGDLMDPAYQEVLPQEPLREVNLAGPDPSVNLDALLDQFLAKQAAQQAALLAQQQAALLAQQQQQAALLAQQQQQQQAAQPVLLMPSQLQLQVAQQQQALLAQQQQALLPQHTGQQM